MHLNLSYRDDDGQIRAGLDFLEKRLYVVRTMVPPGYEGYFQESARYTSAHTSTAIEGNPLDDEAAMLVLVEGADPESPDEVEKVSLEEAYELVALLAADKATKVDEGIIRTVNSLVLKGLPDAKTRNRGRYRPGPNLIVDAATREVRYRPPPPPWVPELMGLFATDVNTWISDHAGPVAAALAHFGLISIHPFDDGNGRTARLITDMVLELTSWSADGMLSVSKVLLDRLPEYYRSLRETQGENFQESIDVTPFVRFHTDVLAGAATVLEEKAIMFNKRRDEFVGRLGGMLNERQVMGLMFMIDIGPISTSRYARLTNSSQATALTDLSFLVDKDVAERQGASKSTRYRLHPDTLRTLQGTS